MGWFQTGRRSRPLTVRSAIRRLFGIAVTLVALSGGMFWASASYARRPGIKPASPFAALPVFFNPRPAGVRELATSAVHAIAGGGRPAVAARIALARLGGAALPYVLPALDARARRIATQRLMADAESQLSLKQLGAEFGVSCERARQLEARLKKKLVTALSASGKSPPRCGGMAA